MCFALDHAADAGELEKDNFKPGRWRPPGRAKGHPQYLPPRNPCRRIGRAEAPPLSSGHGARGHQSDGVGRQAESSSPNGRAAVDAAKKESARPEQQHPIPPRAHNSGDHQHPGDGPHRPLQSAACDRRRVYPRWSRAGRRRRCRAARAQPSPASNRDTPLISTRVPAGAGAGASTSTSTSTTAQCESHLCTCCWRWG